MNIRTYLIGFGLSIVLTLVAFGLGQIHLWTDHVFPTHEMAVPALIVLALSQLVVQLFFFLHVGKEKGPRWNLMALLFALIVVVILVGGTLWIMNHLSHEQMHEPFESGIITPQTE